MNQIIAVALGGACGAVIRFLMSTGLYQWLGRDFPYGTLVVNIVGSFMIGLLSETLILQRLAITLEYRSAILVGFIGAFTTFSTFSLETIYLLEQGSINKAALNIIISVVACLFAVWLGLLCGRALFYYSNGVIHYNGGMIPYALIISNALCAFILGIVATVILQKVSIANEYQAAVVIIMIGMYLTLSGLYVILFLLEHGHSFKEHLNLMLTTFLANGLLCLLFIWLGLFISKRL
ncbi:MAG: fluoride efflux transporter CrcB [Methylococcaceae bacterium]